MRYLKIISNFIFGTSFNTAKFVMPSKQRLMRASLREYGARDYWDLN